MNSHYSQSKQSRPLGSLTSRTRTMATSFLMMAIALCLGLLKPAPVRGVILDIGRMGQAAQEIIIIDQHAYVAGDGFNIFNIEDPLNPRPMFRSGFGSGNQGAVAVSSTRAYVATDGGEITVYNITDPSSTRELNRLPQAGRALSLAIDNNHLFVGNNRQSAEIFDLRSGPNPNRIGEMNTGGDVRNIALVRDHAFLSVESQGLIIFDISDLTQPIQVNTIIFGNSVRKTVIDGSLAYVAAGQLGLIIFDVSNPAFPRHVGQMPARSTVNDVAVEGDRAYILEGSNRLSLVDVSKPDRPTVIDSFDTAQTASTIAVSDGVIYVGLDFGPTRVLLHEADPAPPTPDKFTAGSMVVTIEPPEAEADGARWSVHGRPNRASGFQEDDLPPGPQDVRFVDLPNWSEPTDFQVSVAGGGVVKATVTFSRVDGFYFKQVPEQIIRHGKTLEFQVHTDDPTDPQNPGPGNPIQFAADPQPVGPISLDPVTGRFLYTPDEQDRRPFTVILTVAGQQGAVLISPLPNLVAEDIVLDYDRPLPDDESRDYINITETTNPPQHFNDSVDPIETRSIDISGKTLVFEAGHRARLYTAYHGRTDIREMNLYAERVIIRSPIDWPQTRVTIHARELRFEGAGELDTTPKDRTRRPAGLIYGDGRTQGRTGETGLAGGSIDAFVERFHSDNGDPRFIMRGGTGGQAGDGRNGQEQEDLLRDDDGNLRFPFDSLAWRQLMNRRNVNVCSTVFIFGRMTAITRETHFSVDNDPPLTVLCGVTDAPRGEPAVPAGRPGPGGRGGTLNGTVNLASYADFTGGDAGDRGTNHIGGTLFGPFAHSHKEVLFGQLRTGFSTIIGARGLPAAAPGPLSPQGPSGRATEDPNKRAWLHSFALRSIVAFAKDAYLNGRTEETRALLEEYHRIILSMEEDIEDLELLDDDAFAEQVNISHIRLEIETLLHRLDANLDYFGNPAGWVPMLSFEANLQAFRNEVSQSIPILYLSFWLSQAAEELQRATSAASDTRDKLNQERTTMEGQFNQAQEAIPRLTSIGEDLKIKIGIAKIKLIDLERELIARAQQNLEEKNKLPLWKKAVGALTIASHLIPVGQPVVGRIGTGLNLLTQVDLNDPVESATALAPKAIEAFSQTNITVCFKASSVTNETKKAKLARLTKCGKVIGSELKQLAGLFKASKVDKKELEAELARIKASDPAFKAITEELTELNKQKEDFALQLDTALQAVANLTVGMSQNLAATHEIERRLAQDLNTLDHNALLHINEMNTRARDRLLKHQYFVAKAFQYRTLQPYDGDFQLNRLFDRFHELLLTQPNHKLPDGEEPKLVDLYTDEIQDIIFSTLNNFDAPELSQSIQFELNEEELRQLNETGKTIINLKDRLRFSDSDENVRISDIRTTQLQVEPVGGPIGTLATLSIKYKHMGVSRLTSKGKSFLFRHYQTEEVNPIVWQTSYDGLDDNFQNSELSPAEQSLVDFLLGDTSTTQTLLLFSRPAAFAEIEISRDVNTDNGVDLAVDQLRLRVDYEFDTEGISRPELDVRVNGNLEPLIVVSQADINNRQDGIGNFSRVYQPFTQVTLEAPATFGDLPFDRWVVDGVEQSAGDNTVTISLLESDKLAEARYQLIVPPDAPLTLTTLNAGTANVGFQWDTVAGARYTIERKLNLNDPEWEEVETRTGTGAPMQFTRPTTANPSAFFRLRMDLN